MSELERVRYDLFVGINAQTCAVICNSSIWAVSLCVSAHRHRVPFLGIQPSNVPLIGSLEQLATLPGRLTIVSEAIRIVARLFLSWWPRSSSHNGGSPSLNRSRQQFPIQCCCPLPSCSWWSSCLIVPVPCCARIGNASPR